MPTREEQIEQGRRVHLSIDRIDGNLKSSPTILKSPQFPIIHKFHIREQNEKDKKEFQFLIDNKDSKTEEVFHRAFEASYGLQQHAWGFPFYHLNDEAKEPIFKKMKQWETDPHHYLLLEFVNTGIVPWGFIQPLPTYITPLEEAMLAARKRGHVIPDRFLTAPANSYGEEEAYYATRMLMGVQVGRSPNIYKSRKGCSVATSIITNFSVPNPAYPKGTPYFIDQLWTVVSYGINGPTIRFIAIEIDGEQHLRPDQKERDTKRDKVLESLGYEVYRIAGWWCRVDPWRIILYLRRLFNIQAKGIDETDLPGCSLSSIDRYICSICNEPMVRWDDNWISTFRSRNEFGDPYETNDRQLAHSECLIYDEGGT